MSRKVCVMCEYFKLLSSKRNVGRCLYRKQYMYGTDRRCENYVPLSEPTKAQEVNAEETGFLMQRFMKQE